MKLPTFPCNFRRQRSAVCAPERDRNPDPGAATRRRPPTGGGIRRHRLPRAAAPLLLLGAAMLHAAGASQHPQPLIWTFDRGLEGWQPRNWKSIAVRNGVVAGETRYDSQLLSPVLNIRAADYSDLLVRVRSDISDGGEVFFGLPGKPLSDARKARHRLPAGPDFVIHRIRLTGAPGWNGKIERIRFDPLNAAGAHVRIDFIALVPSGIGRLLNGGAEIAADGKPIEWTGGNGAVRVRAAPGVPAHSGQWFLRTPHGAFWETRALDESFLNPIRVTAWVRAGAGAAARLRIAPVFRDIAGASIPASPSTAIEADAGKDWRRIAAEFAPPERAVQAAIRFESDRGTTDIDDVRLTFGKSASIVSGPRVSPGAPAWRGAWIWKSDLLGKDHTRVFLRRDLVLPDDSAIRIARMQLTADDGYALTIDGKEVHRTFGERDGWRTPEVLDIARFLHPGRNRILVEARDVTSAQGFLAEGLVVTNAGREFRFQTDASWQAASGADGPWEAACVIGRPPCPPWGPLPREVLEPPAIVRAEIADVPATVGVPGKIVPRIILTAAGPVRHPVYAELLIEQKGKVLRRVWAERAFFPGTGPGRNGRVRSAGPGVSDGLPHWTVPLPWTLHRGEAVLRLVLHGARAADSAGARRTFRVARTPAGTGFPQARIARRDGIVVLTVDGRPVNPTQALFLRPDPKHLANAVRAGIRVFGIGLQHAGFFEHGFDYSALDETLTEYVEAAPDAYLILNLIFDTRYQPWWIRDHPEARVRLEDGSDIVGAYKGVRARWPSMSSPVWRETYARILRNLVRHLKTTPFASRIIGIQPCAGITWEWFHWGAQSGDLVDYSDAGQEDFRRWLRRKYGSDAALRKAWRRPDVTLATARVPPGNERKHPRHGMFFDPATQQDVIDYHRYQHEVVADNILRLCRVIKEESDGRLLCGTYYGYVLYLAESPGFDQGSGHFALHRLLRAAGVDYGIEPTAYSWRRLGEGAASMTAFGSFALHAKLWWDQADLRTHWADQDYGRPPDIRGSIAQMRREVVRALAQGTALQWYDFSKGWIFGDVRLADELRNLQALLGRRREFRPMPRSQTLAVILDEEQMGLCDVFHPPYAGQLVHQQVENLIRSGVAWRPYLFRDLLEHPDLLEHRAFLFLNLFRLTGRERAFLRDRVMRDGRLVAFIGPAGYAAPGGFDPAFSRALLGCLMRVLPEPTAPRAKFATDLPEPWRACAGLSWGTSAAFRPVLAPEQPLPAGTRVLARIENGGGAVAAWSRQDQRCRVFWSAAPGLPPEVLRALARLAGIPVIAASNDNFYIGADAVGIHVRRSGRKDIRLPGGPAAAVEEVFSGRKWPGPVREIHPVLQADDTVLFRIHHK